MHAGVDEPPRASCHEFRVDGADFRRESLLVAFVDEDGLRDGRVGDVHCQTPLFVLFVHVHQFGHIRQFGRVNPVARMISVRASSMSSLMRVLCVSLR